MTEFFPRTTIQWEAIEEPAVVRRYSRDLVKTAIATGLVMRTYRLAALSYGPFGDPYWLVAVIAVGALLLYGALTAHLANFTIRHWAWRAPVFALVEAATELAVSLALVLLGVERAGSSAATLDDWLGFVTYTPLLRLVPIVLFTLVLAAFVHQARTWDHRRQLRQRLPDPGSPPAPGGA